MKNLKSFATIALAAIALCMAAVVALPVLAAMSYSTTVRTAQMQAIVDAIGSGGKMKWYNGCSKPAGVGSAGGCTLLATVTFPAGFGTVSAGVIDVTEAGVTQTSASHVTGTPLFVDITTSADAVVVRQDICGSAPCQTFTGSITTGQNITLSNITVTAGNP